MKIPFLYISWLMCLALVLPACNSSKDKIPSGIMPEKKMRQVFTDALIAEGYVMEHTVQQDSQKSLATKYYNEIFERYHITKEAYYKSYDFYSEHPAIFEKMMGPILDSLSAMEARAPAKPLQPVNLQSGATLTPTSILHNQKRFIPATQAVVKK